MVTKFPLIFLCKRDFLKRELPIRRDGLGFLLLSTETIAITITYKFATEITLAI